MEVPTPGERMFQIYESHLTELERILPGLAFALMPVMDNRIRVQLRRVKSIQSDVRWDYGPLEKIEVLSGDGEPQPA